MNRDDIIRMAREAHRELVTKDYPGHVGQLDPWTMRLLERFAALVAAHERKACAWIADTYGGPEEPMMVGTYEAGWHNAAEAIAADIRARGET